MTSHTAVVPPRLVAPGGPVTRALAVMLDADPDRAEVRALRRAIAMRIEADIALLNRLGGDPDLEPSLCGLEVRWPSTGGDREAGDDNGIADDCGLQEQFARDELVAL